MPIDKEEYWRLQRDCTEARKIKNQIRGLRGGADPNRLENKVLKRLGWYVNLLGLSRLQYRAAVGGTSLALPREPRMER